MQHFYWHKDPDFVGSVLLMGHLVFWVQAMANLSSFSSFSLATSAINGFLLAKQQASKHRL
jgi:hypothetical protein